MLLLKKLIFDLVTARGRAIVMVLSIAVGLVAFNTLTGAHSVLTREISRNYMESLPASLTLELDDVSDEALEFVRAQPSVTAATRRTKLSGRFSTPEDPEKKRAFVFVVDDFEEHRIARLFPEQGAYPPEEGSVVIERSAEQVVGAGIGSTLVLHLPGAQEQHFSISGTVHEPALAPANTEQAAYAYVTQSELQKRGIASPFRELRVIVEGPPQDVDGTDKKGRELAESLEASGLGQVTSISVPPPQTHPHQVQMTTILVLFSLFAFLILVLSSLLTASLISTMMARQVREMGILKTLGASRSQILFSYVLLLQVIALSSWALAFLPAELSAQAFVDSITRLLNFDVADRSIDHRTRAMQLGAASLVPLLVALPALLRGSGESVLGALGSYGVSRGTFGASGLEQWLARLGAWGEFFSYSLRNALRRRTRFLLSLSLLASAGAIYLASANTARSWNVLTERLYNSRHYDFEVGFAGPVDLEKATSQIRQLSEVRCAEIWQSTRTAPATGEKVPIERTYPDGAHGAFFLVARPKGSKLVSFDLKKGRMPDGDKWEGVVLNQVVPDAERYAVGDSIALSVAGHDRRLVVIGKVEEVGTGAAAYVSEKTMLDLVPPDQRETRLVVAKTKGVELPAVMNAVAQVLVDESLPVSAFSPLSVFKNAVAAHFEILVNSLLALAALAALVGIMGLSAALSANVSEDARELAVLRALGATGGQIRALVLREALVVCVGGFLLASLLGTALSERMGSLIGMMSFKLPLPFSPHPATFAALLLSLLIVGYFASWLPARHASRLTVTRSLRAL